MALTCEHDDEGMQVAATHFAEHNIARQDGEKEAVADDLQLSKGLPQPQQSQVHVLVLVAFHATSSYPHIQSPLFLSVGSTQVASGCERGEAASAHLKAAQGGRQAKVHRQRRSHGGISHAEKHAVARAAVL